MVKIIKYDPFRNLFALPRWMDDYDESSFQRGLKVHETDKNIIAEAVVAGVPEEDVEVHIEDGVLTIKAETSDEVKKEGEYRSTAYQYYYTCALSGGQWDKAKADIVNGVVKITIPKTQITNKKVVVKAKSKK